MRRVILSLVALVAMAPATDAGEPWLAPGDTLARHDIQLLVDEGVINLPISAWPIAVPDLAAALDHARGSLSPAQAAAVRHLRYLARQDPRVSGYEVRGSVHPTTLRTFDDDPRGPGTLSAYGAGFFGERWGGRLEVTLVADPEDGHWARLDGSYLSGLFGNWIITVGQIDRWWGSGWQGSLLLSSNARPLPGISLDRAFSDPFESKWLRWVGPWRFSMFVNRQEDGRQDVNHPYLFGARFSFRPARGLEISLERTAQLCGEGRSCDWTVWSNMLRGHDNVGENVPAEEQPGNQLAGWNLRWSSPFGFGRYAVYWQHTGESVNSAPIPRPDNAFDLVGIETWGSAASGGSWRLGMESAGTRCDGSVPATGAPNWNCAYNNNVYFYDGYRSRSRPLGHAVDGDARTLGLRYVLADARARSFTALVRFSHLNEGPNHPDYRYYPAPGPEDWWSVDVTYRRPLFGGWIEASAGGDWRDRMWNDTSGTEPRLSLSWSQEFK